MNNGVEDTQIGLHELGYSLGEELQQYFFENYPHEWHDEEAVTHALLSALVFNSNARARALRSSPKGGITLKATLTKKHDEAEHGADALIRFHCYEPEWKLSTATLIQAKRQEPGFSLSTAERSRLATQIDRMLFHTSEAFVAVYSQEAGINLFPAIAAKATSSADLFRLSAISWPWFLSGMFRGQLGEIVSDRIPNSDSQWQPMWELDIVAQIVREKPLERRRGTPA